MCLTLVSKQKQRKKRYLFTRYSLEAERLHAKRHSNSFGGGFMFLRGFAIKPGVIPCCTPTLRTRYSNKLVSLTTRTASE
jgi:hypothetical protein